MSRGLSVLYTISLTNRVTMFGIIDILILSQGTAQKDRRIS